MIWKKKGAKLTERYQYQVHVYAIYIILIC